MSRLHGWHTTHEVQDNGWPIRYYFNDDEYIEIASCDSQNMAAIACGTLDDTDAKPIQELDEIEKNLVEKLKALSDEQFGRVIRQVVSEDEG